MEKDLLQKGKFTELLAHQEMIGQQQEDMVGFLIITEDTVFTVHIMFQLFLADKFIDCHF